VEQAGPVVTDESARSQAVAEDTVREMILSTLHSPRWAECAPHVNQLYGLYIEWNLFLLHLRSLILLLIPWQCTRALWIWQVKPNELEELFRASLSAKNEELHKNTALLDSMRFVSEQAQDST